MNHQCPSCGGCGVVEQEKFGVFRRIAEFAADVAFGFAYGYWAVKRKVTVEQLRQELGILIEDVKHVAEFGLEHECGEEERPLN